MFFSLIYWQILTTRTKECTAVASIPHTRSPRFESRHWHFFIYSLPTVLKIRKLRKRGREWHIYLKRIERVTKPLMTKMTLFSSPLRKSFWNLKSTSLPTFAARSSSASPQTPSSTWPSLTRPITFAALEPAPLRKGRSLEHRPSLVSGHKIGPKSGLFLLIFILYSTNWQNDKSIHGVLGTWTWGGKMVGADESTELRWHPVNYL